MINQQLLTYIKQQLAKGRTPKEDIKKSLLQNDWNSEDVDEALAELQPVTTPSAPISPSSFTPTQPAISREVVNTTFHGVITLMGGAWNLYRRRFLTLIGVAFIPALVMILAGMVFETSVLSPIWAILFSLVVMPLVLIFGLWGQVSMLYAIKDSQKGIGIIESYRRGWRKILSYWWVGLLSSFVVLGGFMLLIIPGIIFSIWFILALFVLVSEDIKGMDALMKSKEYVKGRWWGTFRRLFTIGIIGFIIYAIIGFSMGFLGISGDSPISRIVGPITSILLTPFFTAYIFLLYKNLKEIRGEFVFEPKGKGKFIAAGIVGGLLIPFALLASLVLSSLNTTRERGQENLRRSEEANKAIQREISRNLLKREAARGVK